MTEKKKSEPRSEGSAPATVVGAAAAVVAAAATAAGAVARAAGNILGFPFGGPVGAAAGRKTGALPGSPAGHARAMLGPSEQPAPDTPLARSQAAFVADLPELLQSHPDEWVAYADGKRLRLGPTQTELYRYCLNELGLTYDRFVVRCIVPEDDIDDTRPILATHDDYLKEGDPVRNSQDETDTQLSADTQTAPQNVPYGDTPLSRSQAAYLADLPDLLQSHPGDWVAYANGQRLRLGGTRTDLYRYCLFELGLTHDRFVVRCIEPECDPQIEYNLR